MASKKAAKAVNKKKAIIIAVVIVLIAAMVTGATFIARAYTDGFKTFADTYVEYDGTVYTSSGAVKLPMEGTARFDVGGAGFDKTPKKFEVKVTVNPDNDFVYAYGKELKRYGDLGNITKAFDIEYGEGFFLINCNKEKYAPLSVVANMEGGEVTSVGELDKEAYYYCLTVTVEGSATISLLMAQLQHIPVDGLIPDFPNNGEVYF